MGTSILPPSLDFDGHRMGVDGRKDDPGPAKKRRGAVDAGPKR